MTILNTITFIIQHPLGSKNKIKSIFRFIFWQIQSRFSNDYHEIRWVSDSILLVKRGDAGLTGNIYVGLHEFQDMGFLMHYLRPKDVFIDVGANAGSYTILASRVVGSKTIAIEPIPDTFKRLVLNIKKNNICDKVKLLNMGLSHTKAFLKFTSNLDCMNHVIHDGDKNNNIYKPLIVGVDKLDNIVNDQEISLIKIDVEGYELQVLLGARNVLLSNSLQAIIIEINSSTSLYGNKFNSVYTLLKKYSFNCYKYCPTNRLLINVNNSEYLNGNVIFIKDLQFVQKRVNESIKFSVNGYDF